MQAGNWETMNFLGVALDLPLRIIAYRTRLMILLLLLNGLNASA